MASPLFEEAVERAAGMSVATLRSTPVDEFRRAVEKRCGATMQFFTAFPQIGRGNVLRDRCISNADAEAAYESALKELS